jgi:phage-related minor tail protein
MGDALESVIFDSENLNDALEGVAETILRNVVNSIGEMAAQWLVMQAVQALVGTAATAASVAQAGTVGAAWAPAAALASLATSGANAIPAAAALTGTTALATTLSAVSGAREMGGQVQPNSQYLVGERGPEIISMGNQPGHVTPNHQLGGGQSVSVTNVFQISTGVEQTVQAEIERYAPLIEERSRQGILKAINSGGAMSRATGRRA